MLQGVQLLSLTALLMSQYSEAQAQPLANKSKQSPLLLLSADVGEEDEMNSRAVVGDRSTLVVQQSGDLESCMYEEELWSGLNSHERAKFSNILSRMGVRMTITPPKKGGCGKKTKGTRRKGVRELHNLKSNVNYEKGGEGSAIRGGVRRSQ